MPQRAPECKGVVNRALTSNLDKALLNMGIVPKWMRDACMDVKALKAKAAAKKKASAASTPRKRSTGGPAT